MPKTADRDKFIEKVCNKNQAYKLKNTEFDYFYPDEENKTAVLLNENLTDEEDLEEIELKAQHQRIDDTKSKRIRDFIIGGQKFRPDFIEFYTDETNLHLRCVTVDEGFESKIAFGARTDKSVEHRIEFGHIKPLKYLKKGKVKMYLDGEAPVKMVFDHYDVGFLFLGG